MYNPLPATPLRANASVLCPRLHKTSPASTPRVRPGRRPPQAAGPSAQKTTPAASRRPGPGRCTGQRAQGPAQRSPQQRIRTAGKRQAKPAPCAQPKADPAAHQHPAAQPGCRAKPLGQHPAHRHRRPNAAYQAHPMQPAAPQQQRQDRPGGGSRKTRFPAPSTSPSPNGDSWPYSTAHPPASPSASAPARYSAGWSRARRSSSALPNATAPGRDSPSAALILLCIKNIPLCGGGCGFGSAPRRLCIYCKPAKRRFLALGRDGTKSRPNFCFAAEGCDGVERAPTSCKIRRGTLYLKETNARRFQHGIYR